MSFATVAVADDKDYEFQQQSKDMGRTTLSIDVLTTMQIFLTTFHSEQSPSKSENIPSKVTVNQKI